MKEAPETDALYFYPGEEMKVGDKVRTAQVPATVEALVPPEKEWAGKRWPNGLIVIKQASGADESLVHFEPYTVDWEGLQLIAHPNPMKESLITDALYYYPGEKMKVGDKVQQPHAAATVEALVAPGQAWGLEVWPDGLIVIEEVWGEVKSRILMDPYFAGWEDLTFVSHAD